MSELRSKKVDYTEMDIDVNTIPYLDEKRETARLERLKKQEEEFAKKKAQLEKRKNEKRERPKEEEKKKKVGKHERIMEEWDELQEEERLYKLFKKKKISEEEYDKMLFNREYGVILPSLRNNELDDTILKSLYKRDFYLEEISEKIRLFYVMLTRCREKMIIVTSLNEDMDSYNRLVPKEKRIKYRSFLDILNSISVIDKYVKDVFCECEKDYDNIRLKEIENDKTNIVIQERVNKINYQIINNKHFSKETNKILDMDTIKKMETGTRIHEELEYASFDDDSNKYIKNLFDNKKISRDYINKYSEYEFIYEKDNMVYNGVIDLMLEYDNYINIIDYKLKNISDDNYIKQLNGYKEYIESISNKKVYIYLYSLVDNILEEL